MLIWLVAPAKAPGGLSPQGWIALGIIGAAMAIVYAAIRSRRKRREELSQMAMEMGFLFSERPDADLAEQLPRFRAAGLEFEANPVFRNVLRGSAAGCETILADRTTGGGRSRTAATVVAFKLATPLPAFMLCPETFVWRAVEKLGFSDIDLDGAPEFSRRFFLHGEDAAAVRAVFNPSVVQACEQMDTKWGLYMLGVGSWLMLYRPGVLVRPQDIREFLERAKPIAEAFRSRASSTFG